MVKPKGPGRPRKPAHERRITRQVRMTEAEIALLPFQRKLWEQYARMMKEVNWTSPRWAKFRELAALSGLEGGVVALFTHERED